MDDSIRAYCKRHNLTIGAFAKRLGYSQHTVKKWGAEREIPASAVTRIEAVTDGELSGRELRPDLYEPRQRPESGAA